MIVIFMVNEILKKYGFRPIKKLGQNFLIDDGLLEREVDYAGINKNDIVLEVGPGIGNLTEKIVVKAGKVVAVEKDKGLCKLLKKKFKGYNTLDIINGDILEIELPKFNKVIGNIPYQISSPLTFRLFNYDWDVAVFIYQKEFAKRMVADPGDKNYSRLSVATQYYSSPELLKIVKKGKFYPRPDVDSALIRLKKKRPPFKVDEYFWQIVRSCFRHKKKKVRNALLDLLDKKNLNDIPHSQKKVFNCSLSEFRDIYEKLKKERNE